MTHIRLVPREKSPLDDLARLAQQRGWKVDEKSARAARRHEAQEFPWKASGGGTVKLVLSEALNHCYVVVAGANADALAAEIRSAIPTFSPAEIVHRLSVARSTDELIAALRMVGAAAVSRYDQTIYDRVREGLEDPDPFVQLAALAAAFYCRWQQFAPLVDQMAASPHVGENVGIIAKNLLGLTHWNHGSETTPPTRGLAHAASKSGSSRPWKGQAP